MIPDNAIKYKIKRLIYMAAFTFLVCQVFLDNNSSNGNIDSMILFVVLVVLLFYIYIHRKPESRKYFLREDGILVKKYLNTKIIRFFPWEHLQSFFLVEDIYDKKKINYEFDSELLGIDYERYAIFRLHVKYKKAKVKESQPFL